MKIAISGKGGVGKTTLSALLVEHLASSGKRVLAIDSDPSPHLARALAFPGGEELRPISEMEELLLERSGRQGPYYNLNPRVDDLPERFMLRRGPVSLMVLGAVRRGGGGCACAENTVLRNLLNHLVLRADEDVVLDMEAGVEHLGRGTVQAVDHLLVVVRPQLGSIETGRQIRRLAADLGIRSLFTVVNGSGGPEDLEFARRELDLPVLGALPESRELAVAEREGRRLWEAAPQAVKEEVARMARALEAGT